MKLLSLSGDITIVDVNETDNIDTIKRDLSKIVKIKYENIGFLFKNQLLFNDKIISDYRIGNDEIVVYFEYENCERYSISDSVDDRLRGINININIDQDNNNRSLSIDNSNNIDQGNNEMIRVFVKSSYNPQYISRTHSFELPPRSQVSHLKRMLADRENMNCIYLISLECNGDKLLDEKTLDYYNIKDATVIITVAELVHRPPCHNHISILPINIGYDKLELCNATNIDQIINKIYDRYDNIDKINIRLYRNADKTESIINNDRIDDSIYYFIEHEFNGYEIANRLNVDSFGISFRCKQKSSSKFYTVKQFRLSIDNDCKINFEKHLLYFLSMEKHERIVELIKQFNDIDSSYLLMEYIDQGSIGSIIMKNGALSETKSAKYAQQILEGLEYLHIHRIIHGNINDSNILIDKNCNVKLSDFGLRTIFYNISNRNSINELLQSEIDAINWLSPEMIRNGRVVPASDIWSFGAVVVEMITGQIPHYGLSVGQIVFSIMKGQIKFTFPQFYKDHIKSFISICLKVQPRERANFDDLYQHSFLK